MDTDAMEITFGERTITTRMFGPDMEQSFRNAMDACDDGLTTIIDIESGREISMGA